MQATGNHRPPRNAFSLPDCEQAMQKEIPQHALHRKTVFREGGKRLKHSCGIIFQRIPFTPSLPSAAFPHVAENGFSILRNHRAPGRIQTAPEQKQGAAAWLFMRKESDFRRKWKAAFSVPRFLNNSDSGGRPPQETPLRHGNLNLRNSEGVKVVSRTPSGRCR